MAETKKARSPWLKRLLITAAIGIVAAIIMIWYMFSLKYDDTRNTKADYTVEAAAFINEFRQNEAAANKKYTEKTVVVNGLVSELEAADTVMNVKMIDTLSGSYVIFAFQQQDLAASKGLKEGEAVSIKGSCSGGTYSAILEAESISFKRCAINK